MSEKRGAGRPRHNPKEAKRVPLNMRTTPSMRGRLADAAAESGRSLAQEVEARLLASFTAEDQLRERFGGKDQQALFQMLAGASQLISGRLGANPLTDFKGYLALREAWQDLLRSVSPAPDDQLAERIRRVAKDSQKAEAAIPELPAAPPPASSGLLSGPSTREEREEHLEAMKRYQDELVEYRAALDQARRAHISEHEVFSELAAAEEVGREIARQTLEQGGGQE